MRYGYVDVVHRCLVFAGDEEDGDYYDYRIMNENRFNLQVYLDLLFAAQEATTAETPEEAELVLKMAKAETENQISFIDNNFFLDSNPGI